MCFLIFCFPRYIQYASTPARGTTRSYLLQNPTRTSTKNAGDTDEIYGTAQPDNLKKGVRALLCELSASKGYTVCTVSIVSLPLAYFEFAS